MVSVGVLDSRVTYAQVGSEGLWEGLKAQARHRQAHAEARHG